MKNHKQLRKHENKHRKSIRATCQMVTKIGRRRFSSRKREFHHPPTIWWKNETVEKLKKLTKTMENNKQLWKNMKNTENRFGPHANSDQNRTEAVFIKETRFSSSPNDVMKKWDGWKTKENKKNTMQNNTQLRKHEKYRKNDSGQKRSFRRHWSVVTRWRRVLVHGRSLLAMCGGLHCLSHVRSKKSASYSFTAEELNRLIVIIFEKYARQRKVEEMPLSWRYINHEARLNLEKDVFGERESTWAMGSPEQCTRGLSQLRRSFFD